MTADGTQQTLDLGDGPPPEHKPRTFCPRCGRGPLTGGKCGWCRGTGSRAATSEVGGRDPA